MAFKGCAPLRAKIVINDKPWNRLTNFAFWVATQHTLTAMRY